MDLMSYVWERSGLVSDCRMLIVDVGFLIFKAMGTAKGAK